MARDWVKMRTELYRDPKVVLMANVVAQRLAASSCNVTRNVTRNAVVGALVTVWGILRHNGRRTGDDLVIAKGDLQMIDDISELPGMGEAMQEVEWVFQTDFGLKFPAFFSENNVDPNEDKAAKNAERQRRYRENKAKTKPENGAESNVTGNVTGDVTVTHREEESRVENESICGDNPKPEAKVAKAIPQTLEDVIIPKTLRSPECQEAIAKWFTYLDQIGAEHKRPDASAIALQEWYMQMARMGAEKFCQAVSLSISGKHQTVKQGLVDHPFDKPVTSKTLNEDWLQALSVCRQYPSGSQEDTEARKALLTDRQLKACRAVGYMKIHDADSFTTKQLEAEFTHILKGIK